MRFRLVINYIYISTFYIISWNGHNMKRITCGTLKIHLIRERFEHIGLKYTNTKEGSKLGPKCYSSVCRAKIP